MADAGASSSMRRRTGPFDSVPKPYASLAAAVTVPSRAQGGHQPTPGLCSQKLWEPKFYERIGGLDLTLHGDSGCQVATVGGMPALLLVTRTDPPPGFAGKLPHVLPRGAVRCEGGICVEPLVFFCPFSGSSPSCRNSVILLVEPGGHA